MLGQDANPSEKKQLLRLRLDSENSRVLEVGRTVLSGAALMSELFLSGELVGYVCVSLIPRGEIGVYHIAQSKLI